MDRKGDEMTELPAELTTLIPARDELVDQFLLMEVVDEESQAKAMDALARTKGFIDKIEAARKNLVKPLNDHVKYINDQIRTLRDPLEKAESKLKGVIQVYRDGVREAQRKEQEHQDRIAAARVERAKAKGETIAVPVVVVEGNVKRVGVSTGKASFRTDWKWELQDISQVPLGYLTTNDAALTEIVKISGGGIKIPGIRIYSVEVPVFR